MSAAIIDPERKAQLGFLVYRYRFLAVYVLIGFSSLVLELVLARGLQAMGAGRLWAWGAGFSCGLVFAYWMNVRFNFKVPKAKRNRAFLLFALISIGSLAFNLLLKSRFAEFGISLEASRFVASGFLFIIAYMLHRRFSFKDFKQVGVAVYANGAEDISAAKTKVGSYPDFIHVDIIDTSYGEETLDPKTYRMEAIRAYWPNKKIHVHLMSRTPLRWLDDVAPYVDVIIAHVDADDSMDDFLSAVEATGKEAGLCLRVGDEVSELEPYSGRFSVLMVLSVPVPGRSGQTFQMEALELLDEINHLPNRGQFSVCMDGGINTMNVHMLNAEMVVSGSTVLNNERPILQIMRLQTSSNYESI